MKHFFLLVLAVFAITLAPTPSSADPGGGSVVQAADHAALALGALPDLAPWRDPIGVALLALAAVLTLGVIFSRLDRVGYLARLFARRCVHALCAWRMIGGGLPGRPALILGAIAICALIALGCGVGASVLVPCIVLGSVYALPAVADEDLDMSVSAAVGAESRVFISYDDIKNVADLEQTAAGTGTTNTDDSSLVHDSSRLKPDRTFRAPATSTLGYDLALVCNGVIRSAVEIEVKLNVFLNNVTGAITSNSIAAASVVTTTAPHGLTSGDTVTIAGVTSSVPAINGAGIVITVLSPTTFSIPTTVTTGGTGGTFTTTSRKGTATATITPPETAQDQSFNFPQGLSVDFTPATSGATIRSVVSVEQITGGGPGNKFSIVSFPASSTFTEVACATDKSFNPPTPQSVSIACRYNPNRWVKKGRGKEQTVDLKAKYSSFGDGLPRINGQRVTMMLELWKDDAILVERVFFGGWRAEVSVNHGDGDNESEASATGKFETFAFFV